MPPLVDTMVQPEVSGVSTRFNDVSVIVAVRVVPYGPKPVNVDQPTEVRNLVNVPGAEVKSGDIF